MKTEVNNSVNHSVLKGITKGIKLEFLIRSFLIWKNVGVSVPKSTILGQKSLI